MRTYFAAPGKLDELHARFRDHTTKLFEKHGITNIGYWVPIENPDNKLIYLPRLSQSRGARNLMEGLRCRSGLEKGGKRIRSEWKTRRQS
jgi:hypothetical protein